MIFQLLRTTRANRFPSYLQVLGHCAVLLRETHHHVIMETWAALLGIIIRQPQNDVGGYTIASVITSPVAVVTVFFQAFIGTKSTTRCRNATQGQRKDTGKSDAIIH